MRGRIELQKGEATTTLMVNGRIFSIEKSDGTSTDTAHFDEAAAQAAMDVAVDGLLMEGWEESPRSRDKRRAAEARAKREAQTRAQHESFASRPDVRAAASELIPWLPADVLDLVEAIAEPDASGFFLRLRGGGGLLCTRELDGPVTQFWFYVDADAYDQNEHSLFYGTDVSPPDPPELDGEVEWVLEDPSHDRFWFLSDSDGLARAWQLDGGLQPGAQPIEQVLQVTLSLLAGRGPG
ncbi:MAG: hypothetical protein U0228_30530 [Myxococcaceae bacterium]